MPGHGEIWRGVANIGKEVTPGVGVPATRKMYFRDVVPPGTGQEARAYQFSTGTRDPQRAVLPGVKQPGGQLVAPISSDENLELYLMGLEGTPVTNSGGVTITPGVAPSQHWLFDPRVTATTYGTNTEITPLDSGTIEFFDGMNAWREVGASVGSIRWAGNVNPGGEHLVTANLVGLDFEHMAGGITPNLLDRAPSFHEGWETQIYVDDAGAAFGTTKRDDWLVAWDITYDNRPERKFFGNNQRQARRIVQDTYTLTGTLDIEAAGTNAFAEWTNEENTVQRVVRLVFGDNKPIGASGTNLKTWLDISAVWRTVDLGQTDRKTRIYRMTLEYLFDVVNGYAFRVHCFNGRAAAWT
jgi:hypothetical protein